MDIKKIIESLNPHERKILPYLEEKIEDICKKSNLDKTSVIRALEYLQNKNIINLLHEKKKIVEIGVNGALYRKKELPERRLLNILREKRILNLKDAQKLASLSNDEFKASIGALKKKAFIELKNRKLILSARKEEITKKTPEEILISLLPLDYDSLTPEQIYALTSLKSRKDIVEINEDKNLKIQITSLGEKIVNSKIKKQDLIEQQEKSGQIWVLKKCLEILYKVLFGISMHYLLLKITQLEKCKTLSLSIKKQNFLGKN